MRRLWVFIIFFTLACQALAPGRFLPATPLPATAFPTEIAAALPSLQPSPPPTQLPTVTPQPAPAQLFSVTFHPDGPLYVGDRVSLEIVPPDGFDVRGQKVQIQVDVPAGQSMGALEFRPYGIGGRVQATFLWTWNTSNLSSGEHVLTFSVLPNGPTWTKTVSLLPANQVPPPEPQAHWASTRSQCCILYYITGTPAERDLSSLLQMADQQAQDAAHKLNTSITEPIPVVLLPRTLGQGGFTSKEISVVYSDRNYAGSTIAFVLHHEMIHWFDGHLGGDFRPTMLVEGLAVYLTGGHFKPEPLMPRAAALLPPSPDCGKISQGPAVCSLDRFIPLATLTNQFYNSQHEIGYLEAAGLIEYMVKTWGWQQFNSFYRDIHLQTPPNANSEYPHGSQARALDLALQAHFHLTLAELEAHYVAALRQEDLTQVNVVDVQTVLYFYDTMRRYQQTLDPSAYFLNTWLPDTVQMRQQNIVADLLRRPQAAENVALGTLMVSADIAMRSADYPRSVKLLNSVNAVMNILTGKVDKSLSGVLQGIKLPGWRPYSVFQSRENVLWGKPALTRE